MQHIIVGGGPAGYSALYTLAKLCPEDNIILISKEPYPYYSRVLTSYYLGNIVGKENLFMPVEQVDSLENTKCLRGFWVTRVDAEKHEVFLNDGRKLVFDRLLLATGALPKRPDIPGIDFPGVFVLRSLDDAESIKSWAEPGSRAIILGGGLVGLKAAEGLHRLGLHVTVVVSSGRILSQILDQDGADMMQGHLERYGYRFILRNDVEEILGTGKVEKVRLSSGETIKADLVIAAKGVTPEKDFLDATGVKINRGILVDEFLETNISGIFAAGDITEAYDRVWKAPRVNALWGNAVEQGEYAAWNMAGQKVPYPGSISMNSLKMEELGVISGGIVNPSPGFEVYQCRYPQKKIYRKLVLGPDRALVGMVALGSWRGAGTMMSLLGKSLSEAQINNFLKGSFDFAAVYKEMYRGRK